MVKQAERKEPKPLVRRLLLALAENPVIPAVRAPDETLEELLAGDHPAIFVLGGDVFKIVELCRRARRRPPVCINVDMVGGIASDASGLGFLSGRVDGIISTHRHVIEIAKQTELLTIQRLFAIDSSAVRRGMKLIRQADPDGVEILPGIVYPEIAAEYASILKPLTLAGGLVKDPQTVRAIVGAGAAGVSTSTATLWRSLDAEPASL